MKLETFFTIYFFICLGAMVINTPAILSVLLFIGVGASFSYYLSEHKI